MSDWQNRTQRNHGREYRGIVPLRDVQSSDMLVASEMGFYEEPTDDGIELRKIFAIIFSRKWMIAAITLLGLAAAFVLTLRVVPLYASVATIEIQQNEFQIIEGASVGPDLIADSAYMETQYKLIRSRSLAERVAEELNLVNDPRYASQDMPRDVRLAQASGHVAAGTTVAPDGRSRLVKVGFISPYPEETARIANGVAQAYIQTNLERKFNTTAFAREFLDERLASTKLLLEESERKFTKYAEEQGLLDIGGATSGAGSLEESAIVSLNSELSLAESERIRAEQEYLVALETRPSTEFLQNESLNTLRQTRSALVSEYQEKLNKFKADYPDMIRIRSRIQRVETEIASEAQTIIQSNLSRLNLAFEAAVARESSLRERVNELRGVLLDERNRRIEYQILQREVETVRAQYQALLQRSKEVSVASGVGSSNVSIVDTALVPGMPFQPNLSRSLVQAFILSLVVAVSLAFVLNYVDDSIKTPEDVRSKLNIPTIGVIPKISGKKDIIQDALDQPKSTLTEAIATAQAALEFSTIDGLPRSLVLTSTRPGEGKTSTTISLAMSLARSGKKTLIIDADLRKPSFILDVNKSIGLSGLLTGQEPLQDHVVRSKTLGLSVLPAGVIPPDPAQLLSGPRLKELISEAEAAFDIVLVDSPPILNFADGSRLGSVVAGVLVVIQSGLNRTPAIQRTLTQLADSRTNVIGSVLTKFNTNALGYDYGYYYSSYGNETNSYAEEISRKKSKRAIFIDTAEEEKNSVESERWG